MVYWEDRGFLCLGKGKVGDFEEGRFLMGFLGKMGEFFGLTVSCFYFLPTWQKC
jgi:hypothetical protein